MASFTISRADKFPSGTTVYAYPASNWLQSQLPPAGSPQGSSTTSATAGASSVTFSGLADGTRYVAYAQVSGVDTYVGFTTDPASVASSAGGVATGRSDRHYKFVAGVIRNYNDGAGWVLITDGFHPPINIDSVDSLTDPTVIRVHYETMAAGRTVTLAAVPDETMAKNGFHVGASVQPGFADLKIGKLGTQSDYLSWDGSQWVLNLGASSPFAIASSLSASNDILLTHATVDAKELAPTVVERGNDVIARVGTVGADFSSVTQFRVTFYDRFTGAKLTTPNTNCRALLLRGATPRVIAPSDVHIGAYPNSNIWLWGVMQTEAA